MPTFRDKNREYHNQNFFLKDEKLNIELKKKKSILLLKHHFYHEKNILFKKNFVKVNSNIFILSKFSATYNLLKISDCLITDYSSIYIDYLLLNKPIFFYCYDINKYQSENREIYFNYFKDIFTPGKKIRKKKDMSKNIIKFLNEKKDIYKYKRKKSKKFFNFYLDQNNSSRVFDHICKNINFT
jgi:CDP-glycerol glycerophosphotransferase (TagB/SpsB family)